MGDINLELIMIITNSKEKFMDNESNEQVKISKFMSLVLRHSPETIHLNMDENGWVSIQELIDNADKYKNMHLTLDLVKIVVETNDKQRFIISDDGKRIRANQGHSINVDLKLEGKIPPDILFHGTATRFLDSIMKDGLKPMTRQYVHLSLTEEIALTVGRRHGKPIVLCLDTKKMYEEDYKFYLSDNNIWLTDECKTLAEKFEFSGGQIENVARKKTVNMIISGEKPSLETLVSYCRGELINETETGRKIGFTA
jgi:putative RNA 2'-phosphotransferase